MDKKIQKKEACAFWQEKLNHLEEKNTSLLKKLKMARLDGDYKENADWQLINEKVKICQEEIDYYWKKIIERGQNNNSNKFIVYRILTTGQEKIVELTEGREVDPSQGKISSQSPLGTVLAQKKVGETGVVQTEQGKYQVQVIAIK